MIKITLCARLSPLACTIFIRCKMIKLITTVAILLLISTSEAQRFLESPLDFSKTNDFLSKNRLASFPESALAVLKNQVSLPSGDRQISDEEAQRLKVFVALVEQKPEERCTIRDYTAWQYDLDKYVGQKYREAGVDRKKLSPLERLLHFFGLKRAQQCQPAYLEAFKRFFRFMHHKDKIEAIAQLATTVMSEYAETNDELKETCLGLIDERIKFVCYLQATKSFDNEKFAIALRNYLNSTSKPEESEVLDRVEDEKTGKYKVDIDKVIELLFKRVFNPSWYASIDLAVSVGAASYDFDLLDKADWMGAVDVDRVNLFYYIGLYKFVDRVGKWERDSIRRNMIHIIRDESWKERKPLIRRGRPLYLRKVDIESS